MRLAQFGIAAGILHTLLISAYGQLCPPGWRPGTGLPGSDSMVNLITWDPDGSGPQPERLVCTGKYTTIGSNRITNVGTWDGTSWQQLGTLGNANYGTGVATVFNGDLLAAQRSSSGSSVYRWDGTTWQPFTTAVSGWINSLAVYNGKLVVAGYFPKAGSVTVNNIAAWNGTAWEALSSGIGSVTSEVYTLAVYNGSLYAGGAFSTAGGVAVKALARWTGSAWEAVGELDASVSSLYVYDGRLIVTGFFTKCGTLYSHYAIAWDGSNWSSMSGLDDVPRLVSYRGELIAGIEHTAGKCLWAWTGSGWRLFASGLTASSVSYGNVPFISCLTVYGNDLIVTGNFRTIAGIAATNMARYDGTNWHQLAEGMNDSVLSLSEYNGDLVAGGKFLSAPGGAGAHIARYNGTNWQPFGSGVDGMVMATTTYHGELVAGGDFTKADGKPASNIARWDGTTWQPLGSGTDYPVRALTVWNDRLIAAGDFWTAGGVRVLCVASWDGTNWQAMGNGVGAGPGLALAVYNGDLIVGGDVAGLVTRWDGTTWSTFGGGLRGVADPYNTPMVYSLCTIGNLLVAGGLFTTAGTATVSNIACWDGHTWQAMGAGFSGVVYSLGVYSNELFAGGQTGASYIAKWTGSAWQPLSSSPDKDVYALLLWDGDLVLGGAFINIGTQISAYWARWGSGLLMTQQPTAVTAGCGAAVHLNIDVASTTGTVAYRWRKDGIALTETADIVGTKTAALTIVAAHRSDAGSYDVVITDDCGTKTSHAATVTVKCSIADFDEDGRVDDIDLNAFAACGLGANLDHPNTSLCGVADFDNDQDVDQDDFGAFQLCVGVSTDSGDPDCIR